MKEKCYYCGLEADYQDVLGRECCKFCIEKARSCYLCGKEWGEFEIFIARYDEPIAFCIECIEEAGPCCGRVVFVHYSAGPVKHVLYDRCDGCQSVAGLVLHPSEGGYYWECCEHCQCEDCLEKREEEDEEEEE